MERLLGRWIVPIVASLLLCSLLAPTAAGGTVAAQTDDADAAGLAALSQEFEADRVDFRITVHENGSATWLFRYEQGLADDEERSDFEAFAEEFTTSETDLYVNFRERARSLTDAGANETGREMNAEGFRRDARTEGLDENLGVVEMSFRWEGFARVEGDRVVMGDLFEDGLYIGPDQRLIVEPGPDLAFADVQPTDGELDEDTLAESGAVTWVGERSFNPGRPRVEFVDADAASGATPTGTATATPTATPTAQPPAESDSGWMLPVGAFVLALLLGSAAAVAYRSGAFPPTDADGTATDSGDGAGGATTTAGAASDAGTGTNASGEPAVPDEELISDEERVVNLLEENGGRMKQVNIVDKTGWSKSKVSMLLSDMEEEGTISKLRVGRENIVSLSGHEPDAAGSPFDEED